MTKGRIMSRRGSFVRCVLSGSMAVFIALPVAICLAVGLRVGPSETTLQNVSPGDYYDFKEANGMLLEIFNDSDEDVTYSIMSLKSSELDNVPEGYTDIPDSDWFYFDTNTIDVGPNGVGQVRMYLKIPYDDEYFGKHWVVSARIRSVPREGQGLSLACHPRIKIEMKKREEND